MLIFLKLASVELAIERVAARVAQGGHAIPESVIRRRFVAGWYHFENLYRPRLELRRREDDAGRGDPIEP